MMQNPIDWAVWMIGIARAMLTPEAMTELKMVPVHRG
jgi:hypothetical protein